MASDIRQHAGDRSRGQCAQAVRQSIENVLGIRLERTQFARNYGPRLEAAGLRAITNGTPLRPGDVRIIQPTVGHPAGHMQMYTENGWVSDFRQRDEWPGSAYRQNQPSYTTYRYEDINEE
ncbi:unnamed protein product [Rotaria sordida]|uniref:NlpC/P60 domain-containing protein n=1 Tax=Rotaria sordida TaxID=392033 RepID=A0A819S5B4_9BILA|nr:unnamed protein product [Rotaria sordida]CAF4057777.1 unnamed protein product [Rotaria sordida]